MALEDAIKQHLYIKDTCTFTTLAEKLNDKDREALIKAIESGIPTSTIAHALRSEGYKIGEPTINAHRQGKCRCATKTK
jgi:hypothetical protein